MEIRNKTVLCLIIPILGAIGPAFGQDGSLVPVVRPDTDRRTVAFFTSLADTARRLGYPELGGILDGRAAAGSGSGFVHVAEDKTNYVVTAFHVVAGADTAALEFESGNGDVRTFDHCPVVARDEALDLALVAFPRNEKPFPRGLVLSARPLAAGDPILTAGHPDGAHPGRFERGVVTDAPARMPDLVDPALSPLIRHGVPARRGEAGGPLLQADRRVPGGYAVAGVITRRALGAADGETGAADGIAIPAAALRTFLDRALAPRARSIPDRAGLEARCREFLAVLDDGPRAYRRLAPFISDDLLLREGRDAFQFALHKAPGATCRYINTALGGLSPYRGIRLALAFRLASVTPGRAADAAAPAAAVDWNEAADRDVPVTMTMAGLSIGTVWIAAGEDWFLQSFAVPPSEPRKRPPGAPQLRQPYLFFVGGGVILGLDEETPPTFQLIGTAMASPFFSINTEIGFRLEPGTAIFTDDPTVVIAIKACLAARLQLPVKSGGFTFMPYVDARLGGFIPLGSTDDLTFFGLSGAAGVQFCFGEGVPFVLGVEYQLGIVSVTELISGEKVMNVSGLGVYAGIGW